MSNILKGLNENSLADQFMAMAKAKGMNPRLAGTPEQERERTNQMLAQRAKDREMAPKPTYSPEQIEQLKQQLEQAKQGFDSNYEYSDNYSYWKQQSEKAKVINSIKRQLNDAGVEVDESKEADYGADYQSMVKRVGQKAKEGPRKTVWDPVKRVYKTVPAKQSAIKQGVAENVDIGKEWMSDTELDQYVPDALEQEWRELVGYNEDGNAHPLWINMTGDYEPRSSDPQHRAWMVKVANKWFAKKKIPNVTFFDVRDHDTEDELEWLVQIGQQGVAEGLNDTVYPNAEVIKSKNGKPVGEIYQDGNGWGCFHYRADRGYDTIDSREDAIQALKDIHGETARHRPDYTVKGVAEGKMAELEMDLEDPEISDKQFEKMYGMTRKEAREQFSQTDMWAFPDIRDPNRPLHEIGMAEGGGVPQWRVEQSDATGRYYVVSGYTNKSRRVWKNKQGAGDFNKRADAEAKAHELNQGVAEVSDEILTSYLTKVHADSQKHDKDPTKRSPEKRNKSVQGFSRAFNKLDARKEKTDLEEKNNFEESFDMKIEELEMVNEDWQKVNRKDKTSGMSKKAVKAYRRENPGSKLQTAVTTKPSKLKKGSKSAKRRKSFCARMKGMKKSRTSAKTKRDPNSNINKALRRWNCESVEQMQELVMIAEQKIQKLREAANPAQQAAIAINMKKKGQKPKSMKENKDMCTVCGQTPCNCTH